MNIRSVKLFAIGGPGGCGAEGMPLIVALGSSIIERGRFMDRYGGWKDQPYQRRWDSKQAIEDTG